MPQIAAAAFGPVRKGDVKVLSNRLKCDFHRATNSRALSGTHSMRYTPSCPANIDWTPTSVQWRGFEVLLVEISSFPIGCRFGSLELKRGTFEIISKVARVGSFGSVTSDVSSWWWFGKKFSKMPTHNPTLNHNERLSQALLPPPGRCIWTIITTYQFDSRWERGGSSSRDRNSVSGTLREPINGGFEPGTTNTPDSRFEYGTFDWSGR